MRRCLEENMDVVLIGVYLIHVALEVLLKDTIRQFCEPVLKGSVYDRMSVFCYYNQMIFGDVVIDVFFELGNSVNKSTNASLKRWSGLCVKNQRLSVSKLTRIEDATLFEVVIDVLDPYDDDLLQVAPTVWEQLYQKFCGISAAHSVRIKYAQFVLPIILRSDNCFADELVRFAFTTVHKILANDNMDYCRWEKLRELLPDVVWYNSWDKCKRLRKAARRKQYDVDFYA